MKKPTNPNWCDVIINQKGQQMVRTPKGEIIPGTIMTRVTDEIDSPAYCLIKMYVNIKDK